MAHDQGRPRSAVQARREGDAYQLAADKEADARGWLNTEKRHLLTAMYDAIAADKNRTAWNLAEVRLRLDRYEEQMARYATIKTETDAIKAAYRAEGGR